MSQGVHYVYILFRENGVPFYVGMGKGHRWTVHERRAHKRETHKDHIIADMQARGVKLHKAKVRVHLSREEAIQIEILLIAAIGRECDGGPLINQTIGGDGVPKLPPETYARIGRASSARLKGVKRSPEIIAKIVATKQITGRSPKQLEHDRLRATSKAERLAKIKAEKEEAKRKEGIPPKKRRGHPISLETRAKISAAQKGKPRPLAQAAKSREFLRNLTPEQREKQRQSLLATNARKRALRAWQPVGETH